MDLSAIPRMSAEDVVAASLRGLELGEVVSPPRAPDSRSATGSVSLNDGRLRCHTG